MASFADDFNRADDATSPGASWVEDGGTDWRIVSNTLRQNASGEVYRKCRWSSAMDSNNYYSQCVVREDSGGAAPGPYVRGATDATVTYYGLVYFGGDFSYIVEITAGAETILATGGAVTASTSYTARLEANGTALTATRNGGADASTTDGSLTSGSVGVCTYNRVNGANAFMDDWAAADLAAPAGPFPAATDPLRQLRHSPLYRM